MSLKENDPFPTKENFSCVRGNDGDGVAAIPLLPIRTYPSYQAE